MVTLFSFIANFTIPRLDLRPLPAQAGHIPGGHPHSPPGDAVGPVPGPLSGAGRGRSEGGLPAGHLELCAPQDSVVWA